MYLAARMEYLEIFNEANQPLHQTLPRQQVHTLGHWHRTAQVYVLHPQKGYLCHLRSPNKDLFPSLWDISIGGHLNPEESYASCAAREVAEELGISVKAEDLAFISVVSIDGQDAHAQLTDREHAGIFLYETHLEEQAFHFQQEEIDRIAYISVAQLKADLQVQNPTRAYIPLPQHFLQILQLVDDYLNSR